MNIIKKFLNNAEGRKMNLWIKFLLVLALGANILQAREMLLNLTEAELVPPPKEDKFQKYNLNGNITFGTNLEKKIAKDGSVYYYNYTSRITFDLIQDEDFTIVQTAYFPAWNYRIIFSDDFANQFIVGHYLQKGHVDLKFAKKGLPEPSTLSIVKKSNNIKLYANNKLLQSIDLSNFDTIKHIEIKGGKKLELLKLFVYKD